MYPSSAIMTTDTGFDRSYGTYPYDDYRTNNDKIIFPVNPLDARLPSKERVLGILTDQGNKAYSINSFTTDQIIVDILGDKEHIIIGSKISNFMVSFKNNDNTNWSISSNTHPIIATDDNGRSLSIDGSISDGSQLSATNSFIGYWFSFGAFYPNIEL